MLILKSFLSKLKAPSDYRLPFIVLVVFSLFFFIVSWVLEIIYHLNPSPMSILQRYLLPLLALNGMLGLVNQFKTSYVITCQLLILALFVISTIHTLIQFGLIQSLGAPEGYSLTWGYENNLHLFNIPLSLFKSLGSIGIFMLFLRNKKQTGV